MQIEALDYIKGIGNQAKILKNVNRFYIPAKGELFTCNFVEQRFESSRIFWSDKHRQQKRLYSRYRNAKLFNRDSGYSNLQIAQPYYIVDIIHSFLVKAMLREYPFGKASALGVEDFPGKQHIDRTHKWQHSKPFFENPLIDALKMSTITGSGCLIPGWKYEGSEFLEKVPRMFDLGNGQQMETGEYDYFESVYQTDHIDVTSIEPWRVYPQAGGAGDIDRHHHVMFKLKFFKHELFEMQRAGYIKNVEHIEQSAYNADMEDFHDELDSIKVAKREYTNKNEEKDSIELVFYWGKFPYYANNLDNYMFENVNPDDREIECLIIKPENVDLVLKIDKNPYQCKKKPLVMIPYERLEGECFGEGPLGVAEKLLQHNEDMFNMAQDAANREVYRRWIIPESMGAQGFAKNDADGILKVPDTLMERGKFPFREQPNQYVLPNLREQRAITQNLIYEVTGAIDMMRGVSGQEESATKSSMNWQAMNARFTERMNFIERNGLKRLMEWQIVLNHQFLDDNVVAALCGIAPEENPFKQIIPVLPMMDFDWIFEGSKKAVENPIKAQLIRGIIEMLPLIPPGEDELGRKVVPNTMVLFREFIKNLSLDDDIEKYFTVIPEQQAQMREQALLGGGDGRKYQTGGKMGAVAVGDLNAGMQKPQSNDIKLLGA